jgi:hypothetical protein
MSDGSEDEYVEYAYVRTMLVRTYLDEKRLAWARVRLFRETPEPPPAEEQTGGVVLCAVCDIPTAWQAGAPRGGGPAAR